jgi:hypothetical protein
MADAEEKARQEKIAAAKKRVSIPSVADVRRWCGVNPIFPGRANEEKE